jgi:hypothetical protein
MIFKKPKTTIWNTTEIQWLKYVFKTWNKKTHQNDTDRQTWCICYQVRRIQSRNVKVKLKDASDIIGNGVPQSYVVHQNLIKIQILFIHY